MTTLLQLNFESSKTLIQIERMMQDIEAEIPRDQKRWGLDPSKMSKQLEIIKQFAEKRPHYLIQHLQEYFKLGETVPITLSVEGNGNILVHNLPIGTTPLSINYFKNFPVTITATPQKGGVWSHWSDGNTNATRTLLPDNHINLTAIFK